MNAVLQLISGFSVGFWGYQQIPLCPEDGCVTLLVGGLLMVSSLDRLLRTGVVEDSTAEANPTEKESGRGRAPVRRTFSTVWRFGKGGDVTYGVSPDGE